MSGTTEAFAETSPETSPETTAQEIMSTKIVTILEGETLEEAMRVLINHRVTGLPVVDREGRVVGILSEYDVIQQISKHKRLSASIFQETAVFSPAPLCISCTTPLKDVIGLILDSKYRRLPVVDGSKRLVGLITRRDLMRVFYYRAQLS